MAEERVCVYERVVLVAELREMHLVYISQAIKMEEQTHARNPIVYMYRVYLLNFLTIKWFVVYGMTIEFLKEVFFVQ